MKLKRCELYDKTELESKFKFGQLQVETSSCNYKGCSEAVSYFRKNNARL